MTNILIEKHKYKDRAIYIPLIKDRKNLQYLSGKRLKARTNCHTSEVFIVFLTSDL